MRLVREVEIEAPPERVFGVVTDLATHLEWRPSAVEFRTTDGGPVAVGSEVVEVVRFAGRNVRTVYRVTELDEPAAFAAESVEGPLPVVIRFTAEPAGGAGDGAATRVVFTFDTERPRVAGILPFPFFGPLMGRYMDDELARLKRLVEARGA